MRVSLFLDDADRLAHTTKGLHMILSALIDSIIGGALQGAGAGFAEFIAGIAGAGSSGMMS